MRRKMHWMIRLACCTPLLAGCTLLAVPGADVVGRRFQGVERQSTSRAEGAYQLGRYYQAENQLDRAVAAYGRALEADAGLYEARNGLGVACAMLGRYDEAIAELQTASKQAPHAAHILSNLGYAHYLKGDYEQAISTLDQAIALDPDSVRARNNLSLAYAAAGIDVTPEPTSVSASDAVGQSIGAQRIPDALPLQKIVDGIGLSPLIMPASRVQLVQLTANVYELREPEVAQRVTAAAPADTDTPVEVANGNGVNGMARKVAQFIDGKGYRALHRTNWKDFSLPATRIEYRTGFRTQARQLGLQLPGNPQALPDRSLRPDVDIRVILGKDMVRYVAVFGGSAKIALVSSRAHDEGQ